MVSLASRSTPDSALVSSIERLIARFREHHATEDTEVIRRAGMAAIGAHEGQLRRTGEPYVTHPIAVAGIVADLGLDAPTIVAALLHDAVEDTGITTQWLAKEFGEQVTAVVDGVTKLDRLEFDSKEAQQAATIRKMFIAMAQDWRVLMIKLADRLHNMRTISVMPMHRQRSIAQETLDVYAPLAHRLGVQQVKWQLEDLSFATLHPKRYAEIEQMVAARQPEREAYLIEVMDVLTKKLRGFAISAEVTGRPKHLWSIYEKMVVGGKEFDDIYDLVGLRVIVEEDRDCWAVL
ncbi:MAG TPA: HD domain-containing protein, partial [Acidimicrobiales bacterium]